MVPLTEQCFSASKNPISVGSAGVALSSLTAHLGSIRQTCSMEQVGPTELREQEDGVVNVLEAHR